MNAQRTTNRRLHVLIAIGIILLILGGWYFTKRVPKVNADGEVPNAAAVAWMGTGDSSKTSASFKSRVRVAQGKDLIQSKVKSLLNIRSGEIGIITIPEAALNQYFPPLGDPLVPHIPVFRNFIDKKSLISGLEGILKEDGAVDVRVSGQNITEYSGKDFHFEVEMVAQSKEICTVRIHLTSNGVRDKIELSVYPGYSLVYQFPPPADVGVVIMIGDDSSPATGSSNK